MIFSNIFVIIYIVGTAVSFLLNQALEYTDFSFRAKNGRTVPAELSGHITAEQLKKTCAYEDAKYKLWILSDITETAINIILLFSGFYPYLFNSIFAATNNIYWTVILFAFIASIPSAVVSVPFSLYQEFVIEKKFGFSKMTFKLWLADELKNILIGGIMSAVLLLIMTVLFEHATSSWWYLLGIVYILFSLGISVIYPMFIAPLFNKFTPLENGELKTRVTSFMERTGFKANGVFIMDASKRSAHSNAYFTGIGKSKRVVLYDTLVSQLTTDEIGAVLGHELGHYKKHHIVKRLCAMIPLIFAALFIVSILITRIDLYTSFGFSASPELLPHMKFIGLFLLGQIFSPLGIFWSLISNYFSRRDEYQADAYAKYLCGTGEYLSTALIKLNKENMSEITPPAIYCVFNYSHPTLLERMRAIK